MIQVGCVFCGYETVLFETNFEGRQPCPECPPSNYGDRMDAIFAERPVPVVDGRPALVVGAEKRQQLGEDLAKIFDIAADHGVIEDA